MTWPTIFANLAGGNQPLSLFDTMFTQVAQMVAIPSSAAGVNAITLTPIGTAPSLSNYQNFSSFRFVAGATTTGGVAAQYQALSSLPVYLSDGVTQASAGSIVANQEYVLVFAQFLNGGIGGFFLEAASEAAGALTFAPNVQVFISGSSATYTTPTAAGRLPLYLRVRMVGGGGGGGATNTNNGTNGGDSSFAGWTAIHGAGGNFSATAAAAGGSGGVNGTGTLVRRIAGNPGGNGVNPASNEGQPGGLAGPSFLGGAGATPQSAAGGNAAANSGSGGGGGGTPGGSTAPPGGGGAAGEYVEFIITAPAASYVYTVGAAGVGGSAGGAAGGNGAAGRIEVEAFWQ